MCLCSSILVWPFKTLTTRWRQTSAAVLSWSSPCACPALWTQPGGHLWSSFWISLTQAKACLCPCPTVLSSVPDNHRGRTGTLVTSHLPANLASRTSRGQRKRTEDKGRGQRTKEAIPPFFFVVTTLRDRSLPDLFQMLLSSLLHSVLVIHTTSLASFCPQSFLTGSLLFFSLWRSSKWIIHFDDRDCRKRRPGVFARLDDFYRNRLLFWRSTERTGLTLT